MPDAKDIKCLAINIGCYDLGEKIQPGVRADIGNWRKYLVSLGGGAWHENEVLTLDQPSKAQILQAISKSREYDFTMLSFSGHGYELYSSSTGKLQTILMVSKRQNVEMTVTELTPLSARSYMVLDCCRGVHIQQEERTLAFAAESAKLAAKIPSRQAHREFYRERIQQMELGPIKLYACELNEVANDDAVRGGSFTSQLIRCGVNWREALERRYSPKQGYDTEGAFNCASPAVTAEHPSQHPRYEGGRRLFHAPFAVYVP